MVVTRRISLSLTPLENAFQKIAGSFFEVSQYFAALRYQNEDGAA